MKYFSVLRLSLEFGIDKNYTNINHLCITVIHPMLQLAVVSNGLGKSSPLKTRDVVYFNSVILRVCTKSLLTMR